LIKHIKIANLTFATSLLAAVFAPVSAASAQEENLVVQATYADLVDLSSASETVLRAEIRKQAELKPERSIGVEPGYARLYIEARTNALITGQAAVGESLQYLVDVPRQANGKPPKLKKQMVLLFARPVSGRAGQVQLVKPSSQLLWSEPLEARLRGVLSELVAPDASPVITGIRDVLSIPGNLAGESETQLFLSTQDNAPVSVSVIRRPGQKPVWGVSWSEIVDQAARPPRRETLEWYRLACFLPGSLPDSAHLSADRAARRQADADYRYVLTELGDGPRNRS
jgi:hypothetical protein